MANEIVKKEETALTYGASADLGEIFAEELDGLTPSFERIKIPAGGGLAYEVPGDDPESHDSAKEFKAVILYHHPISCYYKEEYTGGNNPPDCGSMDGRVGIEAEFKEYKKTESQNYEIVGSMIVQTKAILEILTTVYANSKNLPQGVKDLVNLKYVDALKKLGEVPALKEVVDDAVAQLESAETETIPENTATEG